MSTKRLLIIDGHSLAFRAFFALPADNFRTQAGQATNAVYGFLSMFSRMVEEESPDRIAVAFDVSRQCFRTQIYPQYKATRDETPPDFIGQIELIKQALAQMTVTTVEKDGFEADDILATLATQGQSQGWDVLIASGDRDTFQLITDKVTVLYPSSSISDLRRMTPQAVVDKYGVSPEQYSDLAALVGEVSDNLPGVALVGPKTAAQWLQRYGGLEQVLAAADQIGGKRGHNLRLSCDDVRRNRRLNRLVTQVELPIGVEQLPQLAVNRTELDLFFDSLEIGRLRERIYSLDPSLSGPLDAISLTEQLKCTDRTTGEHLELQTWLEGKRPRAIFVEGDCHSGMANATGLGLADEESALAVDLTALTPTQETALSAWLAAPDCPKYTIEGKCASHALAASGLPLAGIVNDVALGAYILRPDMRSYTIEELSQRYLGTDLKAAEAELGLFAQIDQGALASRAGAIFDLVAVLNQELDNHEGRQLLEELELPTQQVLIGMESAGIAGDLGVLQAQLCELDNQVQFAREQAYRAIDGEINLSSPKQLQEVLFDKLQMPKTRKTKTGYTTNAEALNDLFLQTGHPFLAALLEHRDKIKMAQIVEGLKRAVQSDGRIHTTFQQTVTATGRLSSTDPNLQNIPARTPEGLRIREGFVAGPGFTSLMTADYSQIEMRIMAHMSGDEALIRAFESGEDLHRSMAALVFGVSADDVTARMRSRIKATSYGLAYGLSAFGLSRQLRVSVGEAKELTDSYFERFGGVRDYLQATVAQARKDGYTQTMMGRRRYLPDLNSTNRQRREMAERAALNAPIQGSAADIIKKAMVALSPCLSNLNSRLLLQVHDELVLEVAPGEVDQLSSVVRQTMTQAVALSVPLEVSIGIGSSWKDAAH